MKITDLVKPGKRVSFLRYQSGELWYRHDDGFEFPVPTSDTGEASFLVSDNAMFFMRWMRKHLALIAAAKDEPPTIYDITK